MSSVLVHSPLTLISLSLVPGIKHYWCMTWQLEATEDVVQLLSSTTMAASVLAISQEMVSSNFQFVGCINTKVYYYLAFIRFTVGIVRL